MKARFPVQTPLPTERSHRTTLATAGTADANWKGRAWRSVVAWTAAFAVVAGGLGLVADGARLVLARSALRIVLAGGLSAAGLAVLLSFAVGPVFAVVATASARLASAGLVGKLLSPVPVLSSAALAAFVITNVRHRQDSTMRLALVAGCAVLVTLCLLAARPSAHRLFRVGVLGISGGMFLIDAVVPRWYYREVHDLLALTTICGVLAFLAPWRRRIEQKRLTLFLGVSAVLGVTVLMLVDRGAPGWRSRAHEHGLYGEAMARAARALIDFDRDGFSPVAWGGDCNDFSALRNPLAVDAPGRGDLNCNGVDPPRSPTEADRGLAPAVGEPNLAPDAVDLVLLVTVDAWRADSLTAQLMPHLWAAAQQGVIFDKAYASGTRTAVTLPLMQKGHRGGLPLGSRLAAQGIVTTAVVADHGLEGTEAIARTFQHVVVPDQGRWQGVEATARTLRAIDEVGTDRHYLWVHYYDAHTPYPSVASSPVPTPQGLDPSYARYATGVAAVDLALGQLWAGLARRGRLARTVVIVTGDHGEAFGEHGMLFHAASAYEPVVRVPAILIAPRLAPGRYGQLACHADIFPTLLGAFALATADDELLGRSWLRLRTAGAAPLHQFAVIRSAHAASGGDVMSPLLAIVDGRHKLTKTIEDGLTELYDVLADPGERVDLWPDQPDVGRRLERALETYRDVVGYPEDEEMADLKTFGARLIGGSGELY